MPFKGLHILDHLGLATLPCGCTNPFASVQPRARHRSLKWSEDKVVLMGIHQVKTHPMPSRRGMQRRCCIGQIRPTRHFVGEQRPQRALELGQTCCTRQCHVDGEVLRHASKIHPTSLRITSSRHGQPRPSQHSHAGVLENACADLKCGASGQHIVHQHHAAHWTGCRPTCIGFPQRRLALGAGRGGQGRPVRDPLQEVRAQFTIPGRGQPFCNRLWRVEASAQSAAPMQWHRDKNRALRWRLPPLRQPAPQGASSTRKSPILRPVQHLVGAFPQPKAQSIDFTPGSFTSQHSGRRTVDKRRPRPSARWANARNFIGRQGLATLPTIPQSPAPIQVSHNRAKLAIRWQCPAG